jgi:hypothetical protein
MLRVAWSASEPGGSSGLTCYSCDLRARLADDGDARQAGLAPPAQPAILVTGRIDPGAPTGPGTSRPAQVTVVLRTESLADVLARQFSAMLGRVTAP